jgi:predicted SPOUT superfamily RNA methylase MTH1
MPITRLCLPSKILKDANRPVIIVFELIFLARVA